MKLREQLLKEHTAANRDRILQWIGADQSRFDQLFRLFLDPEYRVAQRASWPLSYAVARHPGFINKHFSKLLKNLDRADLPEAVRRNTVRLLQDLNIPPRFHGELMDRCFNYVMDPRQPVAVKVFSLVVLDRLADDYPEIKPELKTVIEDQWQHGTAAFHSRARKVLARLN